MATKMKLIKLLQEAKALAQITNRKPAPRPPLLYLMQLRSQNQSAHAPRRRLAVEIEALHPPSPIKINHLRAGKTALPLVVS